MSAIDGDRGLKLLGDKLLFKKLDKLYYMGARTAQIKAAFNRASKPLSMQAKSNAKQFKGTGVLWKSIKMIRSKRQSTLFWVGPAHGKTQRFDAWYAYFQEKGTGGRKTTKGASRGRIRKPHKYMGRAYSSTKGKVRLNIIKELNLLIKKLAA